MRMLIFVVVFWVFAMVVDVSKNGFTLYLLLYLTTMLNNVALICFLEEK